MFEKIENVTERLSVALSGCTTHAEMDQFEWRNALAELYDPGQTEDRPARIAVPAPVIRESLAALNGNRHATADRLGISRTTLWRRLRAMG